MQAVVNHQYKYIMCYSGKAGCTSMRTLYMALHGDELNPEQTSALNGYHNLNEILPYDPEFDYSKYYKFYISRNPYGRIVSAFLDQYVYAKNRGVMAMLEKTPPGNGEPETFIEFLEYLKTVADAERDGHFQTQTYFESFVSICAKRRFYQLPRKGVFYLDYYGDISGFSDHMRRVYRHVFRRSQSMRDKATEALASVNKLNSSFYGRDTYENAALLSISELEQMVYAPKPQDFFISERARELVLEIYAHDFRQFRYDTRKIPHKLPSPEIENVPDDFDWQTYLLLSPDLQLKGINTERTVMRHFLAFGQFEIDSRSYKIIAPDDFDWQKYIAMHGDLAAAGIDNKRDAIIHYLSYGRNEDRKF